MIVCTMCVFAGDLHMSVIQQCPLCLLLEVTFLIHNVMPVLYEIVYEIAEEKTYHVHTYE